MDGVIKPIKRIQGIKPWEQLEWLDRVVHRKSLLETTLGGYGLDARSIKQYLAALHSECYKVVLAHPEDWAPWGDLSTNRPPTWQALQAMRNACRAIFSRLRFIPEDVGFADQEIPLCVFNSPAVEAAKTTLAESTVSATEQGWEISAPGSGLGALQSISVTLSHEVVSRRGDRKLIVAPVKLKFQKMAVYDENRLAGRFLQIELDEHTERPFSGLRIPSETEWKALCRELRLIMNIPLARDLGDRMVKLEQTHKFCGSYDFEIGIKSFGLEARLNVTCQIVQEIQTLFELPPGRDYAVYEPSGISGIVFQ